MALWRANRDWGSPMISFGSGFRNQLALDLELE